jgi:BASS family bile acid:Na+ symporter
VTLQQVALQVLIVTMMVSIGLELRPAEVVGVLRQRAAFAFALAVNLVVFPALALGVAWLLGLSPGLTAGVLLCAAAPGGPSGPVFARLAGGQLAFATSLMVSLGLIGLLTVPLTVTLALGSTVDASGLAWPMFLTLATYQILPLLLAMGVRRRAPELAERGVGPARVLSNLALLLVVVGMLIARGELLLSVGVELHLAPIGLLLIVLLPAVVGPVGSGVVRAGAIVTAVRNLSLALLLASRFFPDPETEVAILVCGFWMLVLPGVVGTWVGRRDQRSGPPAA